jgi:hypothetical protein
MLMVACQSDKELIKLEKEAEMLKTGVEQEKEIAGRIRQDSTGEYQAFVVFKKTSSAQQAKANAKAISNQLGTGFESPNVIVENAPCVVMCKVTIEWLQRRGAIRSRLHIGCMHLCCAMMHRNKIYFANLPCC